MVLECGLIYLPIILDNVDGDALLVWKLGDSHRSLVPPHVAAAVLDSLDKRGSGGGHHLETFIFGELLASLLVDALVQLALVINQALEVSCCGRERERGRVSPAWKRRGNATPAPAPAPCAG
jgi:hypothetical protein